MLSDSQLKALNHVKNYSLDFKKESLEQINYILKMSNISDKIFEKAIFNIKEHAKVCIHFHPDRLASNFKTIIENLLIDGVYKSQFETLISSGSVSAYKGGQRDLWEQDLFGGFYNINSTNNSERPKYGALNLILYPDGPAPNFGSCYFILDKKVSKRCSFTYLDSYQMPKERGALDEFDYILSGLLKDSFIKDSVLGKNNIRPDKLVKYLAKNLNKNYDYLSAKKQGKNLSHYIEAQIHGEINLKNDVEVLVADPSFKNTYIETVFEKLCKTYNIELYWHDGFTLEVNKIPDNFRGKNMPILAKEIAIKPYIDPYTIGLADNNLKNNPKFFKKIGDYKEVLQELKLLWQVLLKYGKPLNKFI
ncbi:MAG: DUF3626 domain-containing protein [Candidatus Sericytochromatia bacterium]